MPDATSRTNTPAVDVVLPTLGRAAAVRDVLADLARQTVLPRRVIVVEQNPQPDGTSELADLSRQSWPFALHHRFVRWAGACRARNLALAECTAEWLLFVDDDVRLRPTVVAELLSTQQAYGVAAVDALALRPQEQPRYAQRHGVPYAWDGFSTCCALVRRAAVIAAGGFDERLTGGYGDDFDLGLRLHLQGVNVLLAPACRVEHLYVPAGGFRFPLPPPWAAANPAPRPSPTMLLWRHQYFTPDQHHGFKLFYLLSQLLRSRPWSWLTEWRRLRPAWDASESWAARLATGPNPAGSLR